jgi:hypothetical protein
MVQSALKMAWYQNRSVQASLIAGTFVLTVAILNHFLKSAEATAPRDTPATLDQAGQVQSEVSRLSDDAVRERLRDEWTREDPSPDVVQQVADQAGFTRTEVEVLRLLGEPNDGYWYTPTPLALRLKMHPDKVRYAADSLYKRGLVLKVIRGDDEPGYFILDEGRNWLAANHLLE